MVGFAAGAATPPPSRCRSCCRAVYVADTSAHVIRRRGANASADWEVLAGQEGKPGYEDGLGRQALLSAPTAMCLMPDRHLAFADSGNACVRRADATSGAVDTLAGRCGDKAGYEDGAAGEARFGSGIKSIACLPNCSVLVGDVSTGRLRCCSPTCSEHRCVPWYSHATLLSARHTCPPAPLAPLQAHCGRRPCLSRRRRAGQPRVFHPRGPEGPAGGRRHAVDPGARRQALPGSAGHGNRGPHRAAAGGACRRGGHVRGAAGGGASLALGCA